MPERGHCPISFALDVIGDKWSLIVIRDMAFFEKRYYRQFLDAGEGIATNILSERLRRLEREGIISKQVDPENRSKIIYSLTDKGIDLVPMLVDLIHWGAKHDCQTAAPAEFLERIENDRDNLITEFQTRLRSSKISPAD